MPRRRGQRSLCGGLEAVGQRVAELEGVITLLVVVGGRRRGVADVDPGGVFSSGTLRVPLGKYGQSVNESQDRQFSAWTAISRREQPPREGRQGQHAQQG